jgi:hypothetical protein
MTGVLNRPCSTNQASYGFSRLARNGLISRVPGRNSYTLTRNSYTLTRDGLLFACFYTRVYDHVLRPLMAPGRANAPRNSPPRSPPSTSSPRTTSPGHASPPQPDLPLPAVPVCAAGNSHARQPGRLVTRRETQD